MLLSSLTTTLIAVGTSTGVEVITRRSTNPKIHALGGAYRVFSLFEPAQQLTNAIRVAAYSDAVSIVCHELIVEFTSKELANRFVHAGVAHYEMVSKAEELVLSIDFSRDVPSSVDSLYSSQYLLENDLVVQDYEGHGRGLANICHESVAKGVKSYMVAYDLHAHDEAKVPRKIYDWRFDQFALGKANARLGNIFWVPPPEIGLGTSKIGSDTTYTGTFRRNDAEGYGCLEWKNGTRYFGQIRDGQVCGYGGYVFYDGGRYFGYWPKNSTKNLGAYISSSRDRVILGVGRGRFPNSYGRQIGLRDGVESFSAFWNNGEPQHRFESMAETNKKIASSMWSQHTADLKAEYESRAIMSEAKQRLTDAAFLTALQPFL